MANIRKRGESYEITVCCGYSTDGKKIRRTKTYKPDNGMTERQIKKEIHRQAVLFEERCRYGQAAADGKIKFDDFVNNIYFENAKDFLSEYEIEHYRGIIKNHISPELGHMRLRDITPVHIQHFVNVLKDKPSKKAKTGTLSSGSVHRYFTVLQSIMHSAYKLGIIGVNPANRDRITLPLLDEETTDIFTEQEISKIFDLLDNESLQFKLLVHLAVNTGCRRGELVGLKWSDVSFSTGVLTIQRSNYKLKGQPIRSKETKNKKRRYLTLPPYCLALLKHYRAEQAQLRFELGDAWCGADWIFIQADGKPMNPTTPTEQFNDFLSKNNLKHIKFHALRHTSATLLLSSGTNIKNVASRLGHSQLKTTNRYVHALEDADRAAADTFEKMFNPDRKMA